MMAVNALLVCPRRTLHVDKAIHDHAARTIDRSRSRGASGQQSSRNGDQDHSHV
jgi:hypothetical protein